MGSTGFWRFSKVPASLSTALASFLHCTLSLFWLMRCKTARTCARYSSVFPHEKMEMLKMVPLGSLILRLSGASLVVTRSVGRTYGMGGQLLSCSFLHSKSFNPLGLLILRMVLILACNQSVVPIMSLLKEDLSGTCRNQSACVVA